MAKRKPWHDSDIIEAVKISTTYRDVLQALGRPIYSGSGYRFLKDKIRKLELDISHFTGRSREPRKPPKKRPLNEYLVEGVIYHSVSHIKKRLIKEGYKTAKCEICCLETWLDAPIALELHHIDGDKYNNLLENLQFLCPNCHATTNTYRGKNTTSYRRDRQEGVTSICQNCGGSKAKSKTTICGRCAHYRARKVERPTYEDLKDLMEKHPMTHIGKMFGVSDVAIKKWLRSYEKEAS